MSIVQVNTTLTGDMNDDITINKDQFCHFGKLTLWL